MVGIWQEQKEATDNTNTKKKGLVTVAGNPSDDLAEGTQNSILKQAGLK